MTYHPQMDGQTKRVNQEVEQFLQLSMNQHQDDWYDWLAIAKFSYNYRVHTSTCSSPFMLDTGQKPQLSIKLMRESNLEALNDFTSWMEAATKEAHSALTQAANDMAHFYDAHHRDCMRSDTRSGSTDRISQQHV